MLLGFAAARWYPRALDFFGTDTIGSMNPWYWAGTLATLYGLFLLFGTQVPEAQPKTKKPAASPKAKTNAKPKH
jgi:hypothetical protein